MKLVKLAVLSVFAPAAGGCGPTIAWEGEEVWAKLGADDEQLFAFADARCERNARCFGRSDDVPHDTCVELALSDLDMQVRDAVDLGIEIDLHCLLDVDPSCDVPDGKPCDPFFGERELGETCENRNGVDDCRRGLFCELEWVCNEARTRCSGFSSGTGVCAEP